MTASSTGEETADEEWVGFGDRLPLGPVPPGTNVLVEGKRTAGAAALVLELVTAGRRESEATVLVSTEAGATDVARRTNAVEQRFGLVTCAGGPTGEAPSFHVAELSTPSDLTGIGIQYQKLADHLMTPGTRVRVGLDTVSTLLLYVDDPRTVFRFLHAFTRRVSSSGGVGFYHVDPTAHDERTVSVIRQPFDGRILVRDDGPELRVEGLRDQPTGWMPFDP